MVRGKQDLAVSQRGAPLSCVPDGSWLPCSNTEYRPQPVVHDNHVYTHCISHHTNVPRYTEHREAAEMALFHVGFEIPAEDWFDGSRVLGRSLIVRLQENSRVAKI